MFFIAVVWIGLLYLTRQRRILRYVLLLLSLIAVAAMIFPGAKINREELRTIYVDRLKTYNNTRYVYGGENHLGIDCSGLVRAAMFRALQIYGTKEHDSNALRSSLRLWWADSNAIDLGKGKTGDTIAIGSGEYSKLSEHDQILPGDLAVTESGSHVLAYLGDETWIEAEPNVGGTHIFKLSGQFASLAQEQVKFVRWRWLADEKP
jgi:cell wall-associated NlpC family hydrolase